MVLDTSRLIDTPEGVLMHVSPVGSVPRVIAFGIDLMIRAVILIAVAVAGDAFGDFGTGFTLVVAFALEWLYPVTFEVLNHGATPGKRMLGIRVVHDNGVPVGWAGSMIRNLLRAVDFLPIGYGFGLISMLCTAQFKRLGDLAAGTIVIYDDPPAKLVLLPDVEPAPPPWPLTPEEQKVLIEFAERAGSLNAARAAEVAGVLGALGGGSPQRLCQYAAWIHGKR